MLEHPHAAAAIALGPCITRWLNAVQRHAHEYEVRALFFATTTLDFQAQKISFATANTRASTSATQKLSSLRRPADCVYVTLKYRASYEAQNTTLRSSDYHTDQLFRENKA